MSQEKMNIQFRIRAVDKFSRVMHNLNRQIDRTQANMRELDLSHVARIYYDDDDVRISASNTADMINEELSRVRRVNIRAGIGDAIEDIERLEKKLSGLNDKSFEVTADTTRARLKLNYLIRKIDDMDSSFTVDANTKPARDKLSYLARRIDSLGDKKIDVTADTSGVLAEINALKALADDKIVIPVDVDTRPAAKKLAAMRKRLRGNLFTMKIDADTSGVDRALERVKQSTDVNLRTGGAIASAMAVGEALDVATRDRKVKVKADTKQADRAFKRMWSTFSNYSKNAWNDARRHIDRVADLSRDIGEILQHSVASFATMLIPAISAFGAVGISAVAGIGNMLGVTAGAAMGLATAFGAAGAGAVAYGALAKSALGDVFAVSEDLARLQEKLDRTTDVKKRAKIQEEMAAYVATLNKEQQKALKSLQDLQSTWGKMASTFEPTILLTFAEGVNVLKRALEDLAPTFELSVAAVDNLMRALSKNIDASDVQAFFDFLNRNAGPMLESVGKALGNFGVGILNLVVAFEPLAKSMSDGFLKMSESFRDWTKTLAGSNEMQKFVDYVNRNWPKVKNIVGSAILGIIDVFKAFAPHSEGFMTALSDGADKFQAWAKSLGESKEFKDFINFIKENTPRVIDFFKEFGDTLKAVGEAMRPWVDDAFAVADAIMNIIQWVARAPVIGKLAGLLVMLGGAFGFVYPAARLFFSFLKGPAKVAWKWLSPALKKGWDGLKKLGGGLKKAGGKVGGFLKKLAGGKAASKLFAGGLTMLSGPIGWVARAVMWLAPIIIRNWDDIAAWTKDIWGKISEFLSNSGETIKGIFQEYMPVVVKFLYDKWQEIKDAAAQKWQEIVDGVKQKFTDMVQSIWDKGYEIGESVRQRFEEVKLAISEKLEAARQWVVTKWAEIKTAFTTKMEEIRTAVVDKFNAIKEWISTKLTEAKTAVVNKWLEIKEAFTTKMEEIRLAVVEKFDAIKQWISDKLLEAKTAVTTKWQEIKDEFTTKMEEIRIAVVDKFNQIKDWITTKLAEAKTAVSTKWQEIKTAFTTKMEEIRVAVVDKFNQIKTWISTKLSEAKTAVVNKWNEMKAKTSEALTNIKKTVQDGFNRVKTWITTKMTEAKTALVNKWNEMKTRTSTIISNIKTTVSNKFQEIKQAISDKIEQAKTSAVNKFNSMKTLITTKVMAMVTAVRNKFNEIKQAISDKLESAKQIVRDAVSKIKGYFDIDLSAQGRKIIESVARGIRNAVGSVTSAMSSVMTKLRGFLPFSPAKWGPLSDIHRLNFGGPIADSIGNAEGQVSRAMNRMLKVPDITASVGVTSAAVRRKAQSYNSQAKSMKAPVKEDRPIVVEVPLHVDGDEFARATYDSRKKVDAVEEDRQKKFKSGGYRRV